MTAKTVSKTDSKYNVKLIAITAMCAALITVTTAFIKIPSPLGYSHAGDSTNLSGDPEHETPPSPAPGDQKCRQP